MPYRADFIFGKMFLGKHRFTAFSGKTCSAEASYLKSAIELLMLYMWMDGFCFYKVIFLFFDERSNKM